jgi:large subunit ribosomal protein L9
MKVILRQDVDKLGRIGDIVTVKDGYARNFLIPRSFAYLATPGAMNAIEVEKKRLAKKVAKERAEAELYAAKLSEVQVSITMKVGEEGKLYGSVTPQMIAQELVNKSYEIDKRSIIIDEPIRSLGVFDVKVKLHQDVFANIKVWVIGEEEQQAQTEA